MKRSITLIEIMIATTIFSILSVTLYFLLRSGIFIRERIELEHDYYQNIYLNLERFTQELRNVIIFGEEETGFIGDTNNLEFYSLLFDYSADHPDVSCITYSFAGNVLSKTFKDPLKKEALKTLDFLDNLETVNFYYFDIANNEWQESWDSIGKLPQGVRIEIEYKDRDGAVHSLKRYVFMRVEKEF